jgi:hypothetical protein
VQYNSYRCKKKALKALSSGDPRRIPTGAPHARTQDDGVLVYTSNGEQLWDSVSGLAPPGTLSDVPPPPGVVPPVTAVPEAAPVEVPVAAPEEPPVQPLETLAPEEPPVVPLETPAPEEPPVQPLETLAPEEPPVQPLETLAPEEPAPAEVSGPAQNPRKNSRFPGPHP